MLLRLALLALLVSCLAGCTTLQSRETPGVKYYSEPDSSSNRNRVLALPFYILGGAAVVTAGLLLAEEDSDQSDLEGESESDDKLIAGGMLIGGYLFWWLGDRIAGE